MDKQVSVEKALKFLELHQGPELLVIPNAWDVASAVLFEQIGAKAIATSSAGVAWSRGYADGEHIPRGEMLDVVQRITSRVAVPVTADLESGYGREPEHVADTIRAAIKAGAVGANIEDGAKRNPLDNGKPLFEFKLAVERFRAARQAADDSGVPFVVNARVDAIYKLGHTPEAIAEAIKRGNAYAEAGARSVFVHQVVDSETIGNLAREIKAPLNVLVAPGTPSVAELKQLGVRRVTFGAGLSRIAWSAAVGVVKHTFENGAFDLSAATVTNQNLNTLFGG
jgi:2-methylisocitrate lyase-like PEP mutase family enzyme